MSKLPHRPFIVIGENIHATRVVLRGGQRVVTLPDGRPALPFADEADVERLLPVPAAGLGRGYVRAMARRQAAAGAHFLDLNVDEVTTDVDGRIAAMRWIVGAVEDATDVALALDSSSAAVLRAGLAAASRRVGALLLNSAALDRLDVLDLAAAEGCSVVLSATGAGSMPANSDERVANARALIDAATARGIGLGALHVDALVLPVAVDPRSAATSS